MNKFVGIVAVGAISLVLVYFTDHRNFRLFKQSDFLFKKSSANMVLNGERNVMCALIKSGDVVFDVGANKGEWTQHILKIHPQVNVYSFEPVPEIFERLKISFGDCSRAYNLAMSNFIGESEFMFYNHVKADSGLSSFFHREMVEKSFGVSPEVIKVKTDTLDNFCKQNDIDRIDFLKIDTEGAELSVLQGASQLLDQQKVKALQFEYGGTFLDSKTTLKQIYDFLNSRDYQVFKLIPRGIMEINGWDDRLEDFDYSNFVAIAKSTGLIKEIKERYS